MKKSKVGFCVILTFAIVAALSSCDQSSKEKQSLSNCDSLLRGRKTLSVDLPVYVVDSRFKAILDTVLLVEKSCQNYKDCVTGFAFRISGADSSNVEISAVNVFKYDYQDCYGIFEYQGYRFICSDGRNQNFARKSDETVRVNYLDFDRENDWFLYSDAYSAWYLVASGSGMSIEGHHLCASDSSQNDVNE